MNDTVSRETSLEDRVERLEDLVEDLLAYARQTKAGRVILRHLGLT